MDKLSTIKKAIAWLKANEVIVTQKDIAEQMGMHKSSISSALSGDEKYLTDSFVEKFKKAFPEYNWDSYKTFEDSALVVNEGFEQYMKRPPTIPLLPISAQGGSLNDFLASIKESDCEQIISPIRGIDFAITVTGESMAPEYPNGSQVLVKKVNEAAFIEWGEVYVLDTCNGTVIKKLLKSENKDCVVCTSINPDPSFAPFEICKKDIYGVYRVLMCMARK